MRPFMNPPLIPRTASRGLVALLAAAAALGLVGCLMRPSFAALLSRASGSRDAVSVALGLAFILLTLLSVQTALGLVFDPRYRDIPFAPQSGAAFAFLVLMVSAPRGSEPSMAGTRAVAEAVAATVLGVAAVYIAVNETFANWQAIWLYAGFLGLAVILARARDAPG